MTGRLLQFESIEKPVIMAIARGMTLERSRCYYRNEIAAVAVGGLAMSSLKGFFNELNF